MSEEEKKLEELKRLENLNNPISESGEIKHVSDDYDSSKNEFSRL